MTLAITVTDMTNVLGNKTLTVQALLESRAKIYVVKVVFGAGDTYVTNGVAANLLFRNATKIVAVIPYFNDAGVAVEYDEANAKIKMYGSNGAANAVFAELNNGNTGTESKTFKFLVIAK